MVAETLLAKGQKVRVIGRSADRLKPFVQKGAEAFVGDVADEAALTRAFIGARAVYALIPPNMAIEDVRGYQDRVSDVLARATEESGVTHAISLSSVGANRASPPATAPIGVPGAATPPTLSTVRLFFPTPRLLVCCDAELATL